MNSRDIPGGDGNNELSDSWWEALAHLLLHRIQVEIIEALRQNGPMSVRDLSDVIDSTRLGHLAHQLRRLRNLGAVACVDGGASRSPIDIPYRLVRELNDDRR